MSRFGILGIANIICTAHHSSPLSDKPLDAAYIFV